MTDVNVNEDRVILEEPLNCPLMTEPLRLFKVTLSMEEDSTSNDAALPLRVISDCVRVITDVDEGRTRTSSSVSDPEEDTANNG